MVAANDRAPLSVQANRPLVARLAAAIARACVEACEPAAPGEHRGCEGSRPLRHEREGAA